MDDELTAHQQEAHDKLSATGRRFFSLIEFDDKEDLVLEIRKHPFGLFLMVLVGFLSMIVILVVGYLVDLNTRTGLPGTSGTSSAAIYGTVAVLAALIAIGILLSAIVFVNDVIFVTSEKIAQVLYKNVITRKVSQLNIGDVQDVTVNQKGIFARIFNYGTLVIETAGEQNNYVFTYVPLPTKASHAIIGAHESYVAQYGN